MAILVMEKLVLEGHIDEIEDGIAFCILTVRGGDLIKYTSEIPIDHFDDEVTVGSVFTLTEGDTRPVLEKFKKWTKIDMEKANKWAEKMLKNIKWE